VHLLHVTRGHWKIMEMRDRIIGLVQDWKADLAIVEDTSSGMGLIQLLKETNGINVIGRTSRDDKRTRLPPPPGPVRSSSRPAAERSPLAGRV